MSDFHQRGLVATLHALPGGTPPDLEEQLVAVAGERPVAVVIPAHASELGTPALARIVSELRESRFPAKVIFSMNGLDARGWDQAKQELGGIAGGSVLLWNDGPPAQNFRAALSDAGLTQVPQGKAFNLWAAHGFLLSGGDFHAVVCHDADILTYSRHLVARLAAAVTLPAFDYGFAKGYYSRIGGRFYGRVTRLFVAPLLRALIRVFGHLPLLDYLDSFRYVLAGEFAMQTRVVPGLPFSVDWGVEVGLLASIFRTLPPGEICQVEVAENYDHKHRHGDTGREGLIRMSREVAVTLLESLNEEGAALDAQALGAIPRAYEKAAAEAIERHRADATINGISYDEAGEQTLVRNFLDSLKSELEEKIESPTKERINPTLVQLPPWNRFLQSDVTRALRDSAEIC